MPIDNHRCKSGKASHSRSNVRFLVGLSFGILAAGVSLDLTLERTLSWSSSKRATAGEISGIPTTAETATRIASSKRAADASEVVESLFTAEFDLLNVKLRVDKMIDPSVDMSVVSASVDRMAAEISNTIGPDAGSAEKLAALRRYLYQPGPWNDYQAFRYNGLDPLGEKPSNRLLQRYLVTREGNCVTMPILFVVLGQRLGLQMTLAEAPLHILVRYLDDSGRVWNLEATSGGGVTRDIWYRQKLAITDLAISKGTYLRSLSREETVALICSFLVEHYIKNAQYDLAVSVSDILLRHYPNFAYGFIKKGSAYGGLLQQELREIESSAGGGSPDVTARAKHLYLLNMEAFKTAEALGWEPSEVNHR